MFHVKQSGPIRSTRHARLARARADVSWNIGRQWKLRARKREYDRQIAALLADFERGIITEKAARERFGLSSSEQKDD